MLAEAQSGIAGCPELAPDDVVQIEIGLIPGLHVVRRIGEGAHGRVFEVRQGDKSYALKIPHEHRRALARTFLREAVAQSRVRHPALAAVVKVGQTATTPYLLMDLAEGTRLSDRVGSAPLTASEVVAIGIQIAGALEAIHGRGLVHGDVELENILYDPSSGKATLVDFSLANEWQPSWAAPELPVTDVPRPTGPQRDLHLLGRALWRCLETTSRDPVISGDQLREGSSVGPSLPAVRPDIPVALRMVLERVLRTPGANARELAKDLRALEVAPERPASDATWIRATPDAGVSARLHGRDDELNRLRAAWHGTGSKHFSVLVVQGPPGSGKTALLRTFLREARQDGRVLDTHCYPTDPQPFSAVRRLVEALLPTSGGRASRDSPAIFTEMAADLLPLLRILSPAVASAFPGPRSMPASDDAEHIFMEGVAEFFARLLRLGRAIVHVDDVQWLDASSRGVLRRVLARVSDAPALLVFSCRSDPDSRDALLRLAADQFHDGGARIDLQPLAQAPVDNLLSEYLAGPLEPGLGFKLRSLTDGTPLSVLETVRTLLDSGLLLLDWGIWRLDVSGLGRLTLPHSVRAQVKSRVEQLSPTSRRVLGAAAVIGFEFSLSLLGRVAELDDTEVSLALEEATHALLIELIPGGGRFAHHGAREGLLDTVTSTERQAYHQRAAETLDQDGRRTQRPGDASSAQGGSAGRAGPVDLAIPRTGEGRIFAIASHYAEGVTDRCPERAREANLEAARQAFAAFDNQGALRFFEAAARLSEQRGVPLDVNSASLRGEAYLRQGAMDQALATFDWVSRHTTDSIERARTFFRIACIHELRYDSDPAWKALELAFEALGEPLPDESVVSVATSAGTWITGWIGAKRPPPPSPRRTRLELLAAGYYQVARLAIESNRPLRVVQAAVRGFAVAERLGPSSQSTKAYLTYGFLLRLLGRRAAAEACFARAEKMAQSLADPAAYSHCLQVRHAILIYAGDLQAALDVGSRCLLEHGHWQELNEFCILAWSLSYLEQLRGRTRVAWSWLERALSKAAQTEGRCAVPEVIGLNLHPGLIALGREEEIPLWSRRIQGKIVPTPSHSESYAWTFHPRLRRYTQCGDLGVEFEQVVAEFLALRRDPRRLHLAAVGCYLEICQARVHQCLRTSGPERAERVIQLGEALRDLKAAERLPVLTAHRLALQGYHEWFRGRNARAGRLFDRAAALGCREQAPGVLWAVNRGRAHLLAAQGRPAAARDCARMAESLAEDQGAYHQARWIREEFGLTRANRLGASSLALARSEESGAQMDRSLSRERKGALDVLRGSALELDPARQARVILHETIRALGADRGFLFMQAELPGRAREIPRLQSGRLELFAGRDRDGNTLSEVEIPNRDPIEKAFATRSPLLLEHVDLPTSSASTPPVGSERFHSAIAAPLTFRGQTVGVVYLDSRRPSGLFTSADCELLSTLAEQIPFALELAKALRDRERLADDLRQALKMEAMGRLAGGIAHDFNNMLSAIRAGADSIAVTLREDPLDPAMVEDVATIQGATDRAAALTRQLLAFSRRQVLEPKVLMLNDIVSRAQPMLRRLLGDHIALVTSLDPHAAPVRVDAGQMEQVLLNLCVNARDAMPEGGTLRIETCHAHLEPPARLGQSGPPPGPYAVLIVSDTGIGMDATTRQRIFEPFFSTKDPSCQCGTGLGLATVYGIVAQSGGRIEVESSPGQGTTFTVHLPVSSEPLIPVGPQRIFLSPGNGSETILLVEDEALVRKALARTLRRLGYDVLVAENGSQAADLVQSEGARIQLLLTDVSMPGMTGAELARRVVSEWPSMKVLFMSGHVDETLQDMDLEQVGWNFLQKPVPDHVLAHAVRRLLD